MCVCVCIYIYIYGCRPTVFGFFWLDEKRWRFRWPGCSNRQLFSTQKGAWVVSGSDPQNDGLPLPFWSRLHESHPGCHWKRNPRRATGNRGVSGVTRNERKKNHHLSAFFSPRCSWVFSATGIGRQRIWGMWPDVHFVGM